MLTPSAKKTRLADAQTIPCYAIVASSTIFANRALAFAQLDVGAGAAIEAGLARRARITEKIAQR